MKERELIEEITMNSGINYSKYSLEEIEKILGFELIQEIQRLEIFDDEALETIKTYISLIDRVKNAMRN